MLGGGETSTLAELLLVASAMEVAVTVTLRLAETERGALYVAPLVVALVKVPHAVPVSPAAETLQVTPFAPESFSTVAANLTVCPASISVWAKGERATKMAGGEAGGLKPPPPPPPQAAMTNEPQTASIILFTGASPPVVRIDHHATGIAEPVPTSQKDRKSTRLN